MKIRFPALVCAAIPLLLAGTASSATTSYNSGSLGAIANGTNTDAVLLSQPGTVVAGDDYAVGYAGGERTTVPFLSALNPAANSQFTIEFWAKPSVSDGDDAPVANRTATGDRSGWVFFQRGAASGWNFRMYNGSGSAYGWDLTGGTSNLNEWSHVVAVWSGSAATLYVNGVLADDSNAAGLNGVYNPNASAMLSVGALFDGGSSSTALVDEVAFYNSALTPAQIANHFNLVASPTPDAYHSTVLADGALLQLTNNVPEPTSAFLIGLSGLALLRRRSRTVG